MLNYKFAFLRSKSSKDGPNRLPTDFGAMYFLYPSESVDFFKFKPIGLVAKIMARVQEKLKKSNGDMEYFKNYGG